MTNLLDIVDENDNVIGTCDRKEAHARELLHRAVHVLVIMDDGRIVVQHRGRHKATYPLHLIFSAAGHVDSGMTYHQAAQQELQEELGITAELHEVAKLRRHDVGIDNEWYTLYWCQHNGPFTGWQEEAENLLYFTLDELNDLMIRQPHLFEECFIKDMKIFYAYRKTL